MEPTPESIEPVAAQLDTSTAKLRSSRGWALPSALILLAVVLGGLAVWFRGEAEQLGSRGAAANRALVDAAATSEVNGQITSALESIFSYDYVDTGKTERVAKEVLAGDASSKYEQLFAEVKRRAPEQKLVLTTKVRISGVKILNGKRAMLLVFADQQVVRTDNNQSNPGAAQLTVTAEKKDGRWKIVDMVTL